MGNMTAGKYLLKVSGCQMSFRDAETLAGQLQQAGYTPADNEAEADVIVFQTCCVRETAERKIYGQINQLKALKIDKT
jgi:tRNA-2-methylthio-N6-dimethylallyladenosine synthase